MNRNDIKFVVITSIFCLSVASFISCLLFSSLITITTMIGNINLDFLLDDDFSDYQDLTITISVVDDSEIKEEQIKSEPITHLPFHVIRGMGAPRFNDFDFNPPRDFLCPPNTYSSLIPTIGWNCNDY